MFKVRTMRLAPRSTFNGIIKSTPRVVACWPWFLLELYCNIFQKGKGYIWGGPHSLLLTISVISLWKIEHSIIYTVKTLLVNIYTFITTKRIVNIGKVGLWPCYLLCYIGGVVEILSGCKTLAKVGRQALRASFLA